ncbi:MAG: hypothetical protein OXH79_18695 [Boseongicola sp.]|nr:hypothetical protein [Boseongicola sp.]
MAGEREQVTRADVAEAVRAMASFPWKEMLDVQRETAQALRGIREDRARPSGDGADGEEAFPTRAAIAAANSRAEIVLALEDVSAMVVSTRTAVYECSGRLASCAAVQESILSAIQGVRRGIRFWGPVLSFLLLLDAADEIRWLARLWPG